MKTFQRENRTSFFSTHHDSLRARTRKTLSIELNSWDISIRFAIKLYDKGIEVWSIADSLSSVSEDDSQRRLVLVNEGDSGVTDIIVAHVRAGVVLVYHVRKIIQPILTSSRRVPTDVEVDCGRAKPVIVGDIIIASSARQIKFKDDYRLDRVRFIKLNT